MESKCAGFPMMKNTEAAVIAKNFWNYGENDWTNFRVRENKQNIERIQLLAVKRTNSLKVNASI